MPSAKISATIAGISFGGNVTRDYSGGYAITETLPAVKTGTLTTRTDATNGVITLTAGHGLVTGNIVNVYWTGGSRKGISATVATNALTITSGTGDNLPNNNTAVTVARVYSFDIDFSIDALKMMVLQADKSNVEMIFKDNDSPANTHMTFLSTAGEPYLWAAGDNAPANPLETSDDFPIDIVTVANPNSTSTLVKLGFVIDNTGI
jgi:hypothetical protein